MKTSTFLVALSFLVLDLSIWGISIAAVVFYNMHWLWLIATFLLSGMVPTPREIFKMAKASNPTDQGPAKAGPLHPVVGCEPSNGEKS